MLAAALCVCIPGALAQTYTVTSLGDTGSPGEFRYEVTLANNGTGGTINFAVAGTIDLDPTLGSVAIGKSLDIEGPGAGLLTINGGAGITAIIATTDASTVAISGLTIANASTAIFSATNLTVSNCVISNNTNSIGYTGSILTSSSAGINSTGEGSLTVINTTFINNTANYANDTFGAAIYADQGPVTITGSTFVDNSAQAGSGQSGYGGAINVGAGTLTIADSEFFDNSAGFGGAIDSGGTLWVTNSTFVGNQATVEAGGAIYNNGPATVTNSTFKSNVASLGGAIDNTTSTLTINNSLIADNNSYGYPTGAIDQRTGPVNANYNVYYNNRNGDCHGCTSNNNATEATSEPLAMPLGNYAGPTETLLPQVGSAAICAASASLAKDPNSNALTTDQRGFGFDYSYCSNGGVDAGAVQSNYQTVTTLKDQSDTTTCTGGAVCSLRDAFALPASGGSADILFLSGLVSAASPGTILFMSPFPAVTGQVNVFGPGANQLTIESAVDGRLVTVNAGATAVLSGLTFAYAYTAGDGGAITNAGTLALTGDAVSGNIATGNGGGISNSNTATVTNSTISGNTSAGNGGGIYNTGTLTLTGSTVSGNTTNGSASVIYGGGIYNTGSLSLSQSTVSGNSVVASGDGVGGGIRSSGALSVANSIVAGNSASAVYADLNGIFTDLGGNVVGTNQGKTSQIDIQLGSLGMNGTVATVPTLIPAPGSPAICAGLASNIPSGATTDERGYPLRPTGGYCTASQVDAGAVQTNYTSIGFVQQPAGASSTVAGSVNVNTDMAPPAIVQVLETNTNTHTTDGVNGVPITLTLAIGNSFMTGNTATTAGAGANAGEATFTGLQISQAELDDTLSVVAATPITTTLGPATSYQFNVVGPLGQFVVTAPSSVVIFSPASFTVAAEDSAGNALTTFNGPVTMSSATDPSAVFSTVVLANGAGSGTVTFDASGQQTVTATSGAATGTSSTIKVNPDVSPALTSPSHSTSLGGPTVFTWSPGAGSTEFQIYIGTTGAGSSNLYKGPDLPNTVTSSASINIPDNGATLYVRLWYLMNSAWQYQDYIYTETSIPTMISPVAGSMVGGPTVFKWDPGVGISAYQVYMGTTGTGSSNLYRGPDLASTATSSASINIPSSGATLYVRLWYEKGTAWFAVDYVYTEATAPSMTSPSAGTLLGGATKFTWNPGSGANAFQLYIGTTGVGSRNLYQGPDLSGSTTTSASINIPANGSALNVRLWYEKGTAWLYEDYTYTEAAAPSMLTPTPGSTIGGPTAFTWNPGTGATEFQIYVGTTGAGSGDVYRGLDLPGSATSSASIAIPANGAALYVRLWYVINGAWQYHDYTYTEAH